MQFNLSGLINENPIWYLRKKVDYSDRLINNEDYINEETPKSRHGLIL
jgi:hypothetical protein